MNKKTKNKQRAIGTGLVALDVVLNGSPSTAPKFYVGGSCGNVLTILAYLGWESYPVARFAKNEASRKVLNDLKKWCVETDLVYTEDDGSTPIIIHRITKDKKGNPKHRFEFRDPETGKHLPGYKPFLSNRTSEIVEQKENCQVFYFDRINRASIDLAKYYKSVGALVFFEPSSIGKNRKQFEECLSVTDIVKFSSDRIPEYKTEFEKGQVPLEIETLGAAGLRYRFNPKNAKSQWHHIPAPVIEQEVIDTAGAGDWCSAGIIKQVCSSPDTLSQLHANRIEECLNYGQLLGALNCRFEGARGLMYEMDNTQLLLHTKKYKKSQKVLLPVFKRTKKLTNEQFHVASLLSSSIDFTPTM